MINYVIYDRPRDFPDKVVIRAFRISPNGYISPNIDLVAFDTVLEARQYLAIFGLMRFERDPQDNPAVVETWM